MGRTIIIESNSIGMRTTYEEVTNIVIDKSSKVVFMSYGDGLEVEYKKDCIKAIKEVIDITNEHI